MVLFYGNLNTKLSSRENSSVIKITLLCIDGLGSFNGINVALFHAC
jgi:hypothetical protein